MNPGKALKRDISCVLWNGLNVLSSYETSKTELFVNTYNADFKYSSNDSVSQNEKYNRIPRKKSVVFHALVTKMVTYCTYRLVPLEQSFGKEITIQALRFRQ